MLDLLLGGIEALKDYVATHVLTCLVPAFLLAGGIVSFVNREVILEYLGEKRSKIVSFSLASVSSFFVAACSCTVIPVASGLYFGGASIGVAFIVLWVAPATNILALTYTGSLLGASLAIARVVAAIIMAFFVGSVMTFAFRGERILPAPSGEKDRSKHAILEKTKSAAAPSHPPFPPPPQLPHPEWTVLLQGHPLGSAYCALCHLCEIHPLPKSHQGVASGNPVVCATHLPPTPPWRFHRWCYWQAPS